MHILYLLQKPTNKEKKPAKELTKCHLKNCENKQIVYTLNFHKTAQLKEARHFILIRAQIEEIGER